MNAARLCPNLCNPMDCSPPGPSVHGWARMLECVALPSPGDLPNSGIEPRSSTLQADSLPSELPGKPAAAAAAAAKSLQSCPTLCDPRDGSPPGSSIPGILPARTLEWVAIAFSSA